MQRFNREPYNPEAQLRCIKPFVMSGVAYQMGQIVDKGTIEVRRLRQMYEARIVEMVTDEKTAALLKPTAPAAKSKPAAAKARAEHRGFGRWFVIEADGTEVGPFSKDVAEARAAG